MTHVDTETAWRGGQQSLLTLAKGLRARGHIQTIVTPATSALSERAIAEGFAVVRKCARNTDIAHAHSGHAHNIALRATLGTKTIRVVTRHVAFAPRHPLIHRLKYTRTCHGIIAVSDAVRDVLVNAGIPASHIQVIHTGIELPPAPMRRALHRPLTVAHMGAFTKEKGQDIAIAAARLLPQIRFLMAGEGPLLPGLRESATANVEFLGFVSDKAQFFSEVDLFLMPSRSEAWGLAALEAMAYGIPVIASDIQGLADIIEPGRSGWLIPPGNAAALAHTIASADPMKFAAAARLRAEQFSVETMARETEQFYAGLLGV
ncbi:MAG: glycosyltransferase family 4 protein [Acidobacteriota bacterium]